MMRQAGRYLPEYRAIREEYTFLEAISTPAIAEEISLQPYERFRPDGVVMYSDILTALEPLGFAYHLESGVGPIVEEPVREPADTDRPRTPVAETLDYVGELLERLSTAVGSEAAVIGFVGGPFTLAAYAVQGRPSKSYMRLRRLLAESPAAADRLLASIGDVLEEFVAYQVAHGADVIQLFDTYAALLPPEAYRETVLPIQRRVLDAADVPTIVFVRHMAGHLDLLAESGADVVGLDWTVPIGAARDQLGDGPVQGNLDPAALFGSPETVRERTDAVIEAAGDRGHILNLGHGVHRETPVENVAAFFETARSISR